jgi:hypothetical protein
LYPLPGENVIDKPGRSAFQHTEFGLMLKIKGIKNLIICGVTTDVCVHSTMREANDNGFDCLLIEDATAASEPHLHAGAVESVKAEGGIFGAVSTADRILAALEVKEEMAIEPIGIDADIKSFDALRLSDGTNRGMPRPQQMSPPGKYGFPPGFPVETLSSPDVMGGPPRNLQPQPLPKIYGGSDNRPIPPQNVMDHPQIQYPSTSFLQGLADSARSGSIPEDAIRAPQPRRSIPQIGELKMPESSRSGRVSPDVKRVFLKMPHASWRHRKSRDDGPSSK